jgi:hypothetical protein
METYSKNGSLSRIMSRFKNCENKIGRICPDWNDNGVYKKLHLQGEYTTDNNTRTSLKFSFIKCENTTLNGNHCKSLRVINDFLSNTIIEMRVIDASINDEFYQNLN